MRTAHRLLLEVKNRSFLVESYGPEVADAIDREIFNTAQNSCGENVRIVATAKGCFELMSGWFDICNHEEQLDQFSLGVYLEKLLEKIYGRAGDGGSIASLAVIGGEWMTCSPPPDLCAPAALRVPASRPSADIDVMHEVLDAIRDGRMCLEFQPVRNIATDADILYSEGLVRMRSRLNRNVMLPGSFIPSLERLGAMQELDRYVVREVVKTLQLKTDVVLGCNISAQSAIFDDWWQELEIELAAAPSVAERLIIEITETAQISRGYGHDFSVRLRRLGVRVAIDDFGVGFGLNTSIEIKRPDFIKIDSSFVKSARRSLRASDKLFAITSLASELCEHVIVEGIETIADAKLVRQTGARWAQGYLLGKPAVL